MTGNHHFDKRHHAHRHNPIDHFHNRHQPTTSRVPSRIHDLKHRNQSEINSHLSVPAGTSRLPLIHFSTKTSNASPINTEPLKDQSLQFREHQSIQTTEKQNHLSEINQQTNKMAPK